MSDYKVEISEAIERIDEDAKRLSRILAWMDQDGEAAEKYREEIAFRLQMIEWLRETQRFEEMKTSFNHEFFILDGKIYLTGMISIELFKRIRDEIEHEADYQDANVDAGVAEGMYKAVEIIDKYMEKVTK